MEHNAHIALFKNFKEIASNAIKRQNENIKVTVNDIKEKLPSTGPETGPERARFFNELEILKQKWGKNLGEYKTKQAQISARRRMAVNMRKPNPQPRQRANETELTSVLKDLKTLTKNYTK